MSSMFSRNVYINCPYDTDYLPTLRPVIFTVMTLGFRPRLALESVNSGAARMPWILNLIKSSQYAIHHLSRLHARMNMPFELGLDIGCRVYGTAKLKRKSCLVFERNDRDVQRTRSDLSNAHVCSHRDRPEIAVRHVRNWLIQTSGASGLSGTAIWFAFNDFMDALDIKLKAAGFRKADMASLPLSELLKHMNGWIGSNIRRNDGTYLMT